MKGIFKDCYKCPDRHVGCHSTCIKHKKAKLISLHGQQEREKDALVMGYLSDRADRLQEAHNRDRNRKGNNRK